MSFRCQVAVHSEWLVYLTLIQQRQPRSVILFVVGDHSYRATHYSQLKYRSIPSVVRTFQIAKMYCNKQKMAENKWFVVGGVSVVQVW